MHALRHIFRARAHPLSHASANTPPSITPNTSHSSLTDQVPVDPRAVQGRRRHHDGRAGGARQHTVRGRIPTLTCMRYTTVQVHVHTHPQHAIHRSCSLTHRHPPRSSQTDQVPVYPPAFQGDDGTMTGVREALDSTPYGAVYPLFMHALHHASKTRAHPLSHAFTRSCCLTHRHSHVCPE